MSSIRKNLSRSWGSLKDHTSFNIAKFSGKNRDPHLQIAILKTTCHDEAPIQERYVQRILQMTSGSRVQVNACVAAIAKRLEKTRNWVVAIKALMLVHRLLLDGDPLFREAFLSYHRHGIKMLDLSKFRDDSSPAGYYYAIFVRAYGSFLDGKINVSNRSVVEPSSSSAIVLYGHNVVHAARLNEQGDGYGHRRPRDSRVPCLKDMSPVEVIERIPVIQQFLGLIYDCLPEGESRRNHMIHIALYLVLRESFWIYSDLQDGFAILLDAFFDMDYNYSLKIYNICVKMAAQIDELAAFYSSCKDMGFCKPSEFPDVNGISKSLLETMKTFLNDRYISKNHLYVGQSSRNPSTYSPHGNDAIDYEIGVVRALPPPHPVQDEVGLASRPESEGRGSTALSRIAQQQEEERPTDLIDFGEASENGKPLVTGWELALMETPSKPASESTALSGGLMLNALYEQAISEQRITSIIQAGSASSVAAPRKSSATSYLALPSTAVESENDPFAASLSVPPPVYVQMSEMSRKQKLMVHEQQQWYLYQQNGMQGYEVSRQNDLILSFQTPLYGARRH